MTDEGPARRRTTNVPRCTRHHAKQWRKLRQRDGERRQQRPRIRKLFEHRIERLAQTNGGTHGPRRSRAGLTMGTRSLHDGRASPERRFDTGHLSAHVTGGVKLPPVATGSTRVVTRDDRTRAGSATGRPYERVGLEHWTIALHPAEPQTTNTSLRMVTFAAVRGERPCPTPCSQQ